MKKETKDMIDAKLNLSKNLRCDITIDEIINKMS